MNYLAQMLRDCSKNRSSSFTEISFPIIQEIQNKIKNKNFNLRKKMRQRLIDRQKIGKIDEKKDDVSSVSKKDGYNGKSEKETINYIEAYDDQKNYQTKTSLVQLQDVRLDDKDTENTFLICILMRKRKSIFKIEEIRRKMRNKENMKRMSLKECDCCERVGKHRCLHTYCEGRCQKLRKSEKYDSVAAQDFQEEYEAIEVAQQMIEEKVKMEDLSLNVVRIIQKEEEAISIPKIDITEKEDQLKEEQQEEILNERDRISENQSKSEISESRRNRSSEQSKVKENSQQQKEVKLNEQPKVVQNEKQPQEEMQEEIEDDLVQIETIQRIPIRKDNDLQETQNRIAYERFKTAITPQKIVLELILASSQPEPVVEKKEIIVVEPKNEVQEAPEIRKDQQSLVEQNGDFLDILLGQLKDNIDSDKPEPEMRAQ